ncbi:FlxA-like family protein [Paenibacillus sambharensis]|nr:FlxA-like family protein [Paenibacillus sambharensis]
MNPISSRGPAPSPSVRAANPYDSQIRELTQQVTRLQEQVQKLDLDKEMDAKVRRERVAALREQMQSLEAQVNQLKIEKMKDKVDAKREGTAQTGQTEMYERSPEAEQAETLMKTTGLYETIKTLHSTKGQMEREVRNLNNEVRLGRLQLEVGSGDEESKAVLRENAERTVFKRKLSESSEIKARIAKLDERTSEEYAKLHNQSNQPADAVIRKEDSADEEKQTQGADNSIQPVPAEQAGTAVKLDIRV